MIFRPNSVRTSQPFFGGKYSPTCFCKFWALVIYKCPEVTMHWKPQGLVIYQCTCTLQLWSCTSALVGNFEVLIFYQCMYFSSACTLPVLVLNQCFYFTSACILTMLVLYQCWYLISASILTVLVLYQYWYLISASIVPVLVLYQCWYLIIAFIGNLPVLVMYHSNTASDCVLQWIKIFILESITIYKRSEATIAC